MPSCEWRPTCGPSLPRIQTRIHPKTVSFHLVLFGPFSWTPNPWPLLPRPPPLPTAALPFPGPLSWTPLCWTLSPPVFAGFALLVLAGARPGPWSWRAPPVLGLGALVSPKRNPGAHFELSWPRPVATIPREDPLTESKGENGVPTVRATSNFDENETVIG